MKRITFLFLGLTLGCMGFSQTVELAKLSAGNMVSSTTLYDREKNDIYGYFLVYKEDKTGKTENKYEYVLLDKNLNKVFDGEFKEKMLPIPSGKLNKEYYGTDLAFSPVYRNGFISIGIAMNGTFSSDNPFKYRLLDVKENKLSDAFTLLPDLTKKYNPEIADKRKNIVFFKYNPNTFGYTIDAPLKNGDAIPDYEKNTYFINEKLDTLWSYSYNENGANKNKYTYISFSHNYDDDKHNKNILIAFKNLVEKNNQKQRDSGYVNNCSYLVFDKNNGKLISEIFPFNKPYEGGIKDIFVKRTFIDEAKQTVTFIAHTMNTKEAIMDERHIQGFAKAVYSLKDGRELKRDYFSWNQLAPYLNIDNNGYVKEKNGANYYLYLHDDVLMKDDGNTIYIMEEYKPFYSSIHNNGAKIKDLFFMELDRDMKVVQFQRIDKGENSVYNYSTMLSMFGSDIDAFGYFDYSGYQDLGNDDYLFFYYNKQKPESGGKKQWVLGIVSYIDGKFSEQKLPLKSEDGSNMVITPAKKGYIMVYETFKDPNRSPELRLEKINY